MCDQAQFMYVLCKWFLMIVGLGICVIREWKNHVFDRISVVWRIWHGEIVY